MEPRTARWAGPSTQRRVDGFAIKGEVRRVGHARFRERRPWLVAGRPVARMCVVGRFFVLNGLLAPLADPIRVVPPSGIGAADAVGVACVFQLPDRTPLPAEFPAAPRENSRDTAVEKTNVRE